MASQNLYEKYGVKEVADITFFRIEKKTETYEAQREITLASILKGSLELRTVYPLDSEGLGEETGFTAYVFSDAEIRNSVEYEDSKIHEYTYEEQICMLFARKQNLISKTGVRYTFDSPETLFTGIEFSDEFASASNSTEKIVVVGLTGSMSEGTYDVESVNNKIKELSQTFTAKAYDVTYSDYAELVVEDEMGYFNPNYLGTYNKVTGKMNFSLVTEDTVLSNAVMWGKGKHKSINDAIEALRMEQKAIDANSSEDIKGIKGIKGGYLVTDSEPDPGESDVDESHVYEIDSVASKFPLSDVLSAVSQVALQSSLASEEIDVVANGSSNRAIYLKVDNVTGSAGAFIYLLHNINFRNLTNDTNGIFQFEDRNGKTVNYQDKVFCGVEWLALVVVGTMGLIFVVNRHGKTETSRVAWMINENGYVADTKTPTLVKNGLIHTTDITVNDETLEATCTVKSIKIHKTEKETKRFVPVLFLDTLKLSNIEQTGEQVFATGGHGNGQLIGWDYGKEITLTLQDALFSPASMSAIFGSYEGDDFRKGVKETKSIDRFNKFTANRSFIVPAGNSKGVPTEADNTAQAVYYDPRTLEPFEDGTPIAEGETYLKYARSIAYEGKSIGRTIEISADKFPGTYKVVGETYIRSQENGKDEKFMFIIPQAKMGTEQTIELSADGEPSVFDMTLNVLRPDDGIMLKFVQFDVVENEEENDGSTMVKDTENLNLLDNAELFKVHDQNSVKSSVIGATEY